MPHSISRLNHKIFSMNRFPSPRDIASDWQKRPGFVWLDSSSEEQGSLSILGESPDLILEGTAQEWPRLQEELERRKNRPRFLAANLGMPEGAAMGYFRFDGSFRFGFYDTLHLYASNGWIGHSPKLSTRRSKEIPLPAPFPKLHFQSDIQPPDYFQMVRSAQEYIAAGDM
jgi:hypothetical protein